MDQTLQMARAGLKPLALLTAQTGMCGAWSPPDAHSSTCALRPTFGVPTCPMSSVQAPCQVDLSLEGSPCQGGVGHAFAE